MNQLFKNPHNILVLSAAFTAMLFAAAMPCRSSAGEIYSFVDEKGVMHFSNAPDDPRYSASSWQHGGKHQSAKGRRHYSTGRRIQKAAVRPRPVTSPEIARLVSEAAGRHGVDPALVKAIIEVESGGRQNARSPKGAVGLMQLMPETARDMGVRDRTDCHQNIQGGTGYFRSLLEKFNGDIVLALAAYNAGPASVEKYKGIPPYLETVRYVRKVLEAWNRYRSTERTHN